jgi:hypothetical protein
LEKDRIKEVLPSFEQGKLVKNTVRKIIEELVDVHPG